MKRIVFTLALSLFFVACGEDKSTDTEEIQEQTEQENPAMEQENPSTEALDPEEAVLELTPLDNGGDLGQTTFTFDEKTIFYYNSTEKKGKITINGTSYKLTKYSFDSKTNSYKISGSGVTISAPNCKFNTNEGEDCFYGTIPNVTITLDQDELLLEEVAVQDCPSY